MRLFGKIDSDADADHDRAFYGLMAPFDLASTDGSSWNTWINHVTVETGVVTNVQWRPRQRFATDRRGWG